MKNQNSKILLILAVALVSNFALLSNVKAEETAEASAETKSSTVATISTQENTPAPTPVDIVVNNNPTNTPAPSPAQETVATPDVANLMITQPQTPAPPTSPEPMQLPTTPANFVIESNSDEEIEVKTLILEVAENLNETTENIKINKPENENTINETSFTIKTETDEIKVVNLTLNLPTTNEINITTTTSPIPNLTTSLIIQPLTTPVTSTITIADISTTSLETILVEKKTRTTPTTTFTVATKTQSPAPIINYSTTVSATPTINLFLRYQDQFVFSGVVPLNPTTTINYHDSGDTTNLTTSTNKQNVLTTLLTADQSSEAFELTDLAYYSNPDFSSFLVNCIQFSTSSPACYNWQYVVDGNYPNAGMDSYELNGGENVYIYFSMPWKITASTSTFPLNSTTTLETWRYNYDNLDNEWTADPNHLIDISVDDPSSTDLWDTTKTVATTTSDSSGQAKYQFTTTGTYYAKITSLDGWSKWSYPITLQVEEAITTPTSTINLNIRYKDQFIYQGNLALSTSTLINYHDSGDTTNLTTSTNKQNVLTTLLTADQSSEAFELTDLAYYSNPDFSSFLVNCIQFSTSSPACYNWQYVVDGNYPSVGMDSYQLTGGENVYIYYGTPWKITASTSTFPLNTTTTLETWRYNYDDLNNEWIADANHLIDISTDPWDTTKTVATTTTDALGQADYQFNSTGTYYAKITSLDLSKWSNPVTLTVTEVVTSTENEDDSNDNGGSGGSDDNNDLGSGGQPAPINSNELQAVAQKILNFIKSNINADGQIVDIGTTDWATMALVSGGLNPAELKNNGSSVLDYIISQEISPDTELNVCAAYTRHYLALYSAGVPVTDQIMQAQIDGINSNSCYANNNYGQNGINDDLFALFALLASGQSTQSNIVKDIISDIQADQTTDGSFTWAGYASADITGAVINVLNYAKNQGATVDNTAITKAKTYLKNNQLTDGGWGFSTAGSDPLMTSWVIMGINSLGETQDDWFKETKNPWHVLLDNLVDEDHYYAWGNIDWFATKHAVPAILGNTWPIDPKFYQDTTDQEETENQTDEPTAGTPATNNIIDTSTTTTSTLITDVTTTTPTTTPELPEPTPTSTPLTPTPIKTIDQVTTPVILTKPVLISETKIKIKKQPSLLTVTQTPQTLSANNKNNNTELANKIIDELPLDTPTRRTAKKALAVSGGGALVVGTYLGLKLLKNVV